MKEHRQQTEDVEKYRFELAEELGIIERADSGKKSRGLVAKYRPARHRHLKDTLRHTNRT
ncbi:MAG: hypothetical protein DDT36_01047 [Firmicutes bacterium]|nr:hypothetical protein [Bacillota bacterium]